MRSRDTAVTIGVIGAAHTFDPSNPPLPILGRGSEERVLLLDPTLCVTQTVGSSDFAVWVRPTMSASGLDDE